MTTPAKGQPVSLGDVFRIPLRKNRFAFARVINLKDGWDLAELYKETSSSPAPGFDFDLCTPLYPPFSFSIADIKKRKISLAGSTSKRPEYLGLIAFSRGISGRRSLIRINQYKSERPITDEEAVLIPEQEFYSLDGMIDRAKEILRASRTTAQWLAETLRDDLK